MDVHRGEGIRAEEAQRVNEKVNTVVSKYSWLEEIVPLRLQLREFPRSNLITWWQALAAWSIFHVCYNGLSKTTCVKARTANSRAVVLDICVVRAV